MRIMKLRRLQIRYSIQQQLRLRKALSAYKNVVFKPCLIGDSIINQHTTKTATAEYFNSISFLNHLNYMTNHRYPYSAADNYGIGGGDLRSIDARKATVLGGKGYNILFFCGGANDATAVTTLNDMKTYSSSIVNWSVQNIDIADIPFYPITSGKPTLEIGTPMIERLADINNAYYKNSADLENGAHIAGLPTPYITSVDDGDEKKLLSTSAPPRS